MYEYVYVVMCMCLYAYMYVYVCNSGLPIVRFEERHGSVVKRELGDWCALYRITPLASSTH